MRPLLFLDIDGVLNGHEWNKESLSNTLKPECVKALNKVLASPCSPCVVISSAWRYMIAGGAMTLKGFGYMMRTHGVDHSIDLVGVTPPDEEITVRGYQISRWLEMRYPNARPRYVVLDDEDYGITAAGHPFVRTNGSVGMGEYDADLVIEMLRDLS